MAPKKKIARIALTRKALPSGNWYKQQRCLPRGLEGVSTQQGSLSIAASLATVVVLSFD